MKTPLLVLLVLASQLSAQQPASPAKTNAPHSPEINTVLMESTFYIQGPSARPGEERKNRFGAAFVMLRRAKAESDAGQFVLITAKHVFEDIKGDTAILTVRRRSASGNIELVPWPINIRSNGKNIYTVHPTADVAAIDIGLPKDSIVAQLESMTNINWLATDEFVNDINLHPGDELLCLGFPLGIQMNGYPVLRSGRIASYPVLPLKKVGLLAYDFRVYPGNSGGPVYFSYSDRAHREGLKLGVVYQKVFGLVTQEASPIENVDPSLGVIVPSVFIKETIDILAGFESKIKEDF
ncbi:MAG: trypsin-like peptidase domain-containing protein [Candidatus Sulfotelmatobacter sp.]